MSDTHPQTIQHVQDGNSNATSFVENTVLIVEDSKVEQARLEAILIKFGYRVVLADNGIQALEILQKKSLLLVISDWRMPEMSGLELCRKLHQDPKFGQPYFILVTGQNTKSDLVAGMDAGADDFITKPFNSEEMRVRLQAGARIVNLRVEALQHNKQLEENREREAETLSMIRKDLDAAAKMQRDLLPSNRSPFPELEVDSLFVPALTVAGDGFNFFPLDDQHLAFYHIDVAGHGIASAMLSFTISRFLTPDLGAIKLRNRKTTDITSKEDGFPKQLVSPNKVVDALNQHFLEKEDCTHYFTMIYGILNVKTGAGQLCQAGHPNPLIVDSSGKVRQLGHGGFPVGMLANATFENIPFQLAKSEQLYLYSDGITDCNDAAGKPFTLQRLAKMLSHNKGLPLAENINIIDQLLKRWHGEALIEDDMSILAIGRLGTS